MNEIQSLKTRLKRRDEKIDSLKREIETLKEEMQQNNKLVNTVQTFFSLFEELKRLVHESKLDCNECRGSGVINVGKGINSCWNCNGTGKEL